MPLLITFCISISLANIILLCIALITKDDDFFKPHLLKKRYREDSSVYSNTGNDTYRIVRKIPYTKALKIIEKYLTKKKRKGLTEINILSIAKDINLPISQISSIIFKLERENKLTKL